MSAPKNAARARLAAVPDVPTGPGQVAAVRWATPCEMSQISGRSVSGQLVPVSGEIPADYPGRSRWVEFAVRMLDGDIAGLFITECEGVVFTDALWHLWQVQTCPGLDREHRTDAVAWLASLWLAGWSQDDSLLFDDEEVAEDADEAVDSGQAAHRERE